MALLQLLADTQYLSGNYSASGLAQIRNVSNGSCKSRSFVVGFFVCGTTFFGGVR
jgi:hypothetical protein